MPDDPGDRALDREVIRGQSVYSPLTLMAYDLLVLGLSNRWIWRAPTPALLEMFDRNVSARHLDVGVGTGWFLDRCRFPAEAPEIALMDLNPDSLAAAARAIARYRPETIRANVLEPVDYAGEPFGSISVNYLLHCVPGDVAQKARLFDHLAPLLAPGGVVFGSTLLQIGVERSWAARRLMAIYNRKGIFHNRRDSLVDLETALRARFPQVEITTLGCCALFVARSGQIPA